MPLPSALASATVSACSGGDQARAQRHPVGARGVHQAVLVHPQVDHVDRGAGGRRCSRYTRPSSTSRSVLRDQRDAHLLGEHPVLEPGRVVRALAEHHHRRDRRPRPGAAASTQRPQQQRRGLLDAEQVVRAGQLRQHALGEPAVLHRVPDAGRHPQVVLQHVPAAVARRGPGRRRPPGRGRPAGRPGRRSGRSSGRAVDDPRRARRRRLTTARSA